jgi:hypothetical protein
LRRSIASDLMPGMTLGKSPTSEDAFRSGTSFCQDRVSETSIYGMLYRESHRLFPDEAFADLFADIGRASVPPRIVSVVMVLQRLEGLSDREAADRITFDLRWKYAAGGLDFDYAGFVHTVLVDMRARLRRSERPNRIFETALEVAHAAGLVGRKRVLDSTALYDAVATQDTVTLIRSAIRALLRIVDEKLGAELRACCKRDDDYLAPGIGRTSRRAKRSWMRWHAMRTRSWRHSTNACCPLRSCKRSSSSRRWSGRIWSSATTGCFGSLDG